jgi:hypothetical protein
MGWPCTKKDSCRVRGTSGKLKNLNQSLFKTAEDIGRLNSVISQLEREVEELQKRLDQDEAMLFGEQY